MSAPACILILILTLIAAAEFVLWVLADSKAQYYRWLWAEERMAREREQQRQSKPRSFL